MELRDASAKNDATLKLSSFFFSLWKFRFFCIFLISFSLSLSLPDRRAQATRAPPYNSECKTLSLSGFPLLSLSIAFLSLPLE